MAGRKLESVSPEVVTYTLKLWEELSPSFSTFLHGTPYVETVKDLLKQKSPERIKKQFTSLDRAKTSWLLRITLYVICLAKGYDVS
jgi:hypothetical protein